MTKLWLVFAWVVFSFPALTRAADDSACARAMLDHESLWDGSTYNVPYYGQHWKIDEDGKFSLIGNQFEKWGKTKARGQGYHRAGNTIKLVQQINGKDSKFWVSSQIELDADGRVKSVAVQDMDTDAGKLGQYRRTIEFTQKNGKCFPARILQGGTNYFYKRVNEYHVRSDTALCHELDQFFADHPGALDCHCGNAETEAAIDALFKKHKLDPKHTMPIRIDLPLINGKATVEIGPNGIRSKGGRVSQGRLDERIGNLGNPLENGRRRTNGDWMDTRSLVSQELDMALQHLGGCSENAGVRAALKTNSFWE